MSMLFLKSINRKLELDERWCKTRRQLEKKLGGPSFAMEGRDKNLFSSKEYVALYTYVLVPRQSLGSRSSLLPRWAALFLILLMGITKWREAIAFSIHPVVRPRYTRWSLLSSLGGGVQASQQEAGGSRSLVDEMLTVVKAPTPVVADHQQDEETTKVDETGKGEGEHLQPEEQEPIVDEAVKEDQQQQQVIGYESDEEEEPQLLELAEILDEELDENSNDEDESELGLEHDEDENEEQPPKSSFRDKEQEEVAKERVVNPTISLWDMKAMEPPQQTTTSGEDMPSLVGVKSIGVDYGLVRTGVATTVGYDPQPLAILSDLNNTQVCDKVLQYAKSEQASKIILGLPLHKNGTVAEQTNLTLVLAQELAQAALATLGPMVPVEMWDERYTSKEAAARAHAQDPNRFLYGSLDADAACIILEHYYHDHGLGRITVPVIPESLRRECLHQFETRQSLEEERRSNAMQEREERMQRRKDAIARSQQKDQEEQTRRNLSGGSKKKKKKKKKR